MNYSNEHCDKKSIHFESIDIDNEFVSIFLCETTLAYSHH